MMIDLWSFSIVANCTKNKTKLEKKTSKLKITIGDIKFNKEYPILRYFMF